MVASGLHESRWGAGYRCAGGAGNGRVICVFWERHEVEGTFSLKVRILLGNDPVCTGRVERRVPTNFFIPSIQKI